MIWLALKVGNWSPTTSHGIKVTVRFDHIGGLTVKAPVILASAAIGQVASIGIDYNDCSACATLRIDQAQDNLPPDTSVVILIAGLLDAQYVELGSRAEESCLKDGDQIEITQSAAVLEHLIGQI